MTMLLYGLWNAAACLDSDGCINSGVELGSASFFGEEDVVNWHQSAF